MIPHGYTYSGHPASAAVALENLRLMKEEGVGERVREDTGPYFQARLRELNDHPLVGEVRGVGLLGSLELARDKTSRELFEPVGRVGALCHEHLYAEGVIFRAMRDVVCTSPPLTITRGEIDELVEKARAGNRPHGAGSRHDVMGSVGFPGRRRLLPAPMVCFLALVGASAAACASAGRGPDGAAAAREFAYRVEYYVSCSVSDECRVTYIDEDGVLRARDICRRMGHGFRRRSRDASLAAGGRGRVSSQTRQGRAPDGRGARRRAPRPGTATLPLQLDPRRNGVPSPLTVRGSVARPDSPRRLSPGRLIRALPRSRR